MSEPHTSPARPNFIQACLSHPASVGETYTEHSRFALTLAVRLLLAAAAAAVHALVPALFETTASRLVASVHATMNSRNHH